MYSVRPVPDGQVNQRGAKGRHCYIRSQHRSVCRNLSEWEISIKRKKDLREVRVGRRYEWSRGFVSVTERGVVKKTLRETPLKVIFVSGRVPENSSPPS